jgi:hypothetical protein
MLEPTPIAGRIVWLGVVRDRRETLCSEPLESVEAGWEGFAGECHGGLTRPSCSRVLKLYPERGTEIRNARQVTILSAEELSAIAADLGLDRLPPEWLGANLVLEGVPALTTLPPASRLVFEGGATLTVDVENGPCRFPAEVIEAHRPGHGRAFPKVARGRRGVVAWVERPGRLASGETARLFVPPQRLYAPLAAEPASA